ncbi:MAG: sigma-70 family RNA polymerase sigma factor [Woeseia sp.]
MTESTATIARKRRFEQLVAVLHRDMYRYAVWLNRDPAIAEDVVQEALLRAWKSLDSLRDDSSAKQWVLTIVRRENARYFERKRLETVDVDNLTPAQSLIIAEGEDTDTDDMRRALFELSDDYREPLVLQVLLGYTTDEIAALMGIKAGAVLTRLHRARHKLKAQFDTGATS